MGWSKGKGLGANEDGEKDFVRIRYKRDVEGFGFEARDDQWTQHEKDFTGLLKNLHGGEVDGEKADEKTEAVGFGFKGVKSGKASMKDSLTGKSLVEMSKTSRARVHYQKFARGKDLSRASEKDLANIFGRKAPAEEDNIFSAFQAVNNFPEEDKEPKKDENPDGTQIVNTGVTITDYFKQKMEAFKLKRSAAPASSCDTVPTKRIKSDESENNIQEDDSNQEEKPKKKKKKDKHKEVEDHQTKEIKEPEEETTTILEKKSKKKKKDKVKEVEPEDASCQLEDHSATNETSEEKPKKKKKKSKVEDTVLEDKSKIKEEVAEEIVQEEKPKKKKKKVQELEGNSGDTEIREEPKSKKKKSELESEYNKTTSSDDEPSSQVPKNTDLEQTTEKEVEAEGEWQEVKSRRENNQVDLTQSPATEKIIDDPKTHKINSYTAEKFRNIDMPAFPGSNISQFKGYGMEQVEQLEVYTRPIDEYKIKEFWKKELIIFDDADAREEFVQIGSHVKSSNELLGMNNYRRKVNVAKKENKKIPKLNLGAIKKRRAFTGI